MNRIRPVILSGGSGTRLWPLSTPEVPKQFVSLFGTASLFEQALTRLAGINDVAAPVIVTGEDHLDLVQQGIEGAEVSPELVIVEPEGRNTAPAALAAALTSDDEDVLIILPSDHLIQDEERFVDAVRRASEITQSGLIVTFGIVPKSAETGYGYIEVGDELSGGFRVRRFEEKPNESDATKFIQDDRHLWNSGIFAVRASVLVDEALRHCPSVVEGVRAAITVPEGSVMRLAAAFCEVESISLDHAVMEKTDRAAVLPMSVGWDDVGSFNAMWGVFDKDAEGNAISGEVVTVDVTGSLILSSSRPVAVAGLEDVVVVETAEGVLVVPRDRTQDVKRLFDDFGAN